MAHKRHLSLEALERRVWREPSFPSRLVTTCHRLRRIPIRDLSVEDLRLLIGQSIGLEYLVPLAIERLDEDPLAAGDFFPGDLLLQVVTRGAPIHERDRPLTSALAAICRRALEMAETSPVSELARPSALAAYRAFVDQNGAA
ncbi:MAG: contact-dependent growth inhibition system immunity protein [Pseudomonadota bacterium]